MIGFKDYVLKEGANSKHALKFLQYEQDEHDKFAKKIREELARTWERIIAKYPPIENMSGDEKVLHSIDLVAKEEKIGRFGNKAPVGPSVKVGGAYERNVRVEVKKKLLQAAHEILQKYADKMGEELPKNPFFVDQDDDSLGNIRLKFKTGEYAKTVFMVGIEPGYKFERVYLKDYLIKS